MVKKIGIALDQLPAIRATVIWTGDGEQFVADGTSITTLRTGAVVGVATDLLARAGRDPAGPPRHRRPGRRSGPRSPRRTTNRPRRPSPAGTPHRAGALAAELAEEFPEVKFAPATSIDDSIADADVICCATSSSTPLFETDALPDRVHVNAIGAFRPTMRELPRALFATASLVVVDQLEAALEESGEVIDAVTSGYHRNCSSWVPPSPPTHPDRPDRLQVRRRRPPGLGHRHALPTPAER